MASSVEVKNYSYHLWSSRDGVDKDHSIATIFLHGDAEMIGELRDGMDACIKLEDAARDSRHGDVAHPVSMLDARASDFENQLDRAIRNL